MTEESPTVTVTDPARKKCCRTYFPLVALLLVSAVIAEVLHLTFNASFMAMLMGFVLVEFGLVKMFDIETFVERFSQYDLISSRVKVYGYLFPVIELVIGLAYIGNYNPVVTSWAMLVVGGVSLLGILVNFKKRDGMKCGCMGSAAEMPLGTITVIENALMVGMALAYITGLN